MERYLKAHLFDIGQAIDEIYSFFDHVPKKFEEYQNNLMLRRAIERNIGIIGEATNHIDKDFPNVSISNARQIIATRNRVIHDYAAITDDIIWSIVINDLPKLKEEITFLLEMGD